MDEKTGNSAEEIEKAMRAQNNLILQCLAFPEKFKPIPGYSEDPHGQPLYVGQDGSVYHIQGPCDFNGWTL